MEKEKERTKTIISGEVKKDISSTEPLIIQSNSHVLGNVVAPDVIVGNHVIIEGDIKALQNVVVGNMCEIGNISAGENISIGQMCMVGKVYAEATAYIMGYSTADSVFGDVEVIAENGCELGDVQSFGSVILATRTLVKACCGSYMVDCFEDVRADYLMSENAICTGENCSIKEMELRRFN